MCPASCSCLLLSTLTHHCKGTGGTDKDWDFSREVHAPLASPYLLGLKVLFYQSQEVPQGATQRELVPPHSLAPQQDPREPSEDPGSSFGSGQCWGWETTGRFALGSMLPKLKCQLRALLELVEGTGRKLALLRWHRASAGSQAKWPPSSVLSHE
jgi:hypothetical protein